METFKFQLSYLHDAENEGEKLNLTLHGMDGDIVILKLTKEQTALLKSRATRSFYVRCKKEKLLYDIDNAASYTELEALAQKYYLCDVCELCDINLYGVKRILKVIVEILYQYPKLRSKLCFIGTHYGMERLLVKLEEGDSDTLNRFHLQYICTSEDAKNLGRLIHKILSALIREPEGYIATFMYAFGLLDAVLLDKNDYDGYAYLKCVAALRRDEESGFHPKGCYSPESVVYHELGHLMDNMCGLADDPCFKEYYDSLSRDEIKTGLSQYALSSPKELIAEAFAEYKCNPAPRPIAKKIGELLDEAYAKVK